MKYIVTESEEGDQQIFIFPRAIDHDCMAEVLSCIKDRSWGEWSRVFRKPIAAGFTIEGKCYGRSETLDLDSRGRDDEILIRELP